MMMRPRFFRGAKRAERGPMTIWGSFETRRLSQIWWRSASVWREWMRVTWVPKVDSKTWTNWEVRAISGTRMMADFCAVRHSEAILR